MFILDEVFSLKSSLSKTEESALYYISAYVAFKENIAVIKPTDATKDFPNSEFTIFQFCGKLSHSPPKTFKLSCVLYFY